MSEGRITAGAAAPGLIAIVSGAAGLVYEIGWARAFALELGAQVPVWSAVLATFLGGLAAGGWLGGRWAARVRRPLRLFALLELATALAGGLVPAGLPLLRPALGGLYQRHLDGGGSFLPPALALACSLILPASILMGATLPALIEHARRSGRSPGSSAGLLYGANTAGAVAGALGGGLVLLPWMGLTRTLLMAAAGNLAAAALALRIARDVPAHPPHGRADPASAAAAPAALLGAVFLAGAAAMVDQVGWTRVLSMLLGSTVYALALILAAFLAGLALGGFAGGRLAERLRLPARGLAWIQMGVGATSLVAFAVLGRLPVWLVPPLARARASAGTLLTVEFVAASLVVMAPTFLMGAAFPVAVRLRAGGSRPAGVAAGEVYAASSAGLVLGGLLSSTWLLPRLGVEGALLVAAALMSVAALVTAGCETRAARAGTLRRAAAGLLAIPAAALLLPRWDAALVTSGPFLYAPLYRAGAHADRLPIADAIRARGPLVFHREGAEATVSVRRAPSGTLSLQINGKTDASTGGDMVTQLLAGHLPGLLAPREARSALLIGLATGVSLRALERYPLDRIDCVELLPQVVEAAALFRDGPADPRVRVHVADGRNHLRHARVAYDVIASQPTNPWVAGTAALFTRETFVAARERLRPGGVFVQWIQGYGMTPGDLASVIATFQDVFPRASLWEESPAGGDFFLVGRNAGGAGIDVPLLLERLEDAEIRADLARAGIEDVGELLAHFVAGPDALARLGAGAEIQRDDRTRLEFSSALSLYRDTLPAAIRVLRRYRGSPAGLLQGLDRTPAPEALLADLRTARARARREERLLLSIGGAGSLAHPDLAVGVELLRSGLPGPARRHLERAAEGGPAAAEAHALLGALHAASGQVPEALRALGQAVRLRPEDVSSRSLLARLQLESGDLEGARAHLLRAAAELPEDPDLLNLSGALALLDDDPGLAAQRLGRAVSLDPGLAEAWINLGVALRRSGRIEAGVEAYRRALELDGDNADARYNLAIALLLSGDVEGGESHLRQVVRGDPGDASARLRLAEIYRGAGRESEARRELEAILRWAPGSGEAAEAGRLLGG